ncbi:MAG: FMN-binding negative transcriptional regulator [Pseudomonadota bacterium]|nr:FMN-binding negative transcriptional regulator [Pseudomonadota bacterium]
MYIPEHFRMADTAACHDLIDANDFALMVGVDGDGSPFATHLPVMLERDEGPFGMLHAHIARANPHARLFGTAETMFVFQAAHAYVSPRWYASSPMVPTWNYTAVHAWGRPEIVDDADAVSAFMARLSARYEGDGPWRYGDLPERYRAGMQKGIIAFRMTITRLEGKAKLSQNRNDADLAGAADGLEATGTPDGIAVARAMRATR